MTTRFVFRVVLLSSGFVFLGAATTALGSGPPWIVLEEPPPESAEPKSEWRFDVMPFAWIAGVSGSEKADGVEIEGGETLVETVTHIDFAGMFRAEAGTGDLSLRLSALYLDIGTEATGQGGAQLDATLKGAIVDVSGGYRIMGDSWDEFDRAQRGTARPGFVDVLAGARVMALSLDFDFDTLPSVDDSATWVDPYVGARGRVYAFPWLVLGADATIGGFGVGSDLAWSAEGVAQFVLSKTVYIALGYTVLDLDYDVGGDDGFAVEVQIRGPWLGVGFVF